MRVWDVGCGCGLRGAVFVWKELYGAIMHFCFWIYGWEVLHMGLGALLEGDLRLKSS